MQELLLDFAAWIDLTSNGDTSITSIVSVDIRAQFGSLKRASDLRVYQGLMMPLNHQAGMQGILKEHLSVSYIYLCCLTILFPLVLDQSHVLC